MAIVERSIRSKPEQWEEFAVLRLSKRELAGIAALIGPTASDSYTPLKMYDEIDNLLDGKAVDIPSSNTVKYLNSTYGEI